MLPTIQLGDVDVDLTRIRTVLLAGSGAWLPYEIWLYDNGAVFGHGAEIPGITLAYATAEDFAHIFAELPLDRPAIVHLPIEAGECPDFDAILPQLPAHAALVVTATNTEVDDRRFSGFAWFDQREDRGEYAAVLREQRGFNQAGVTR